MTTSKQTATDAAKQGNTKAISVLINRGLSKSGIRADVQATKGRYLDVCLYSDTSMPKGKVIPSLEQGLQKLDARGYELADVRFFKTGKPVQDWFYTIKLSPSLPPLSTDDTKVTPVSNNNLIYLFVFLALILGYAMLDNTSATTKADRCEEAKSELGQAAVKYNATHPVVTRAANKYDRNCR